MNINKKYNLIPAIKNKIKHLLFPLQYTEMHVVAYVLMLSHSYWFANVIINKPNYPPDCEKIVKNKNKTLIFCELWKKLNINMK